MGASACGIVGGGCVGLPRCSGGSSDRRLESGPEVGDEVIGIRDGAIIGRDTDVGIAVVVTVDDDLVLIENGGAAEAVDAGEAHLAAMKDAILRAGDRSLETRVAQFAETARSLFRSVESDPGDLTAARKFLSVYLQGARDATAKFADLYAQNRDAKARADYEALLTDLETTFAARTTALLANGHTDLDVEISVLRDRLKYET